jgi:hypothetical protein
MTGIQIAQVLLSMIETNAPWVEDAIRNGLGHLIDWSGVTLRDPDILEQEADEREASQEKE